MTTPREELDALFQEIDGEFGKPKKVKKVPKQLSHNEVRNLLNKEFHERIDGSRNPLTGANTIASSWREDPSFAPVRRIVYTHLQTCKACDHCVEYIANVFTEYYSPRLHASVKAAETVTHGSDGFELPVSIETHCNEVEECVSCLHLSKSCGDLIDRALAAAGPESGQLDIFGDFHVRH